MSGLLKPYSAYTRFILTKWYVKKFNIAGKGEMDIGFILTKWYVKNAELKVMMLFWDSFILIKWYVKKFARLNCPLINGGFILTKWYVKFIFLTHIIQLIQF
ncbi:Uncharacterised protein [Clostridioides difficile]|nr:Uncharacterised protein [Clostridioides difficile]